MEIGNLNGGPSVRLHINMRRRLLHDRRDRPHEWPLRAPDNEEREHDGARWICVHPIVDAVLDRAEFGRENVTFSSQYPQDAG